MNYDLIAPLRYGCHSLSSLFLSLSRLSLSLIVSKGKRKGKNFSSPLFFSPTDLPCYFFLQPNNSRNIQIPNLHGLAILYYLLRSKTLTFTNCQSIFLLSFFLRLLEA